MEVHEIICPDKEEIQSLATQLRETLRECEQERERSR